MDPQQQEKLPTNARIMMSKKLYHQLDVEISKVPGISEEHAATVMSIIRDTFKFHPDASIYSEKAKQQTQAFRQRRKEQGISTYVSSGKKASYERKKQNQATQDPI